MPGVRHVPDTFPEIHVRFGTGETSYHRAVNSSTITFVRERVGYFFIKRSETSELFMSRKLEAPLPPSTARLLPFLTWQCRSNVSKRGCRSMTPITNGNTNTARDVYIFLHVVH